MGKQEGAGGSAREREGPSDGIARNSGQKGDLKLTDGESDNGLGLD